MRRAQRLQGAGPGPSVGRWRRWRRLLSLSGAIRRRGARAPLARSEERAQPAWEEEEQLEPTCFKAITPCSIATSLCKRSFLAAWPGKDAHLKAGAGCSSPFHCSAGGREIEALPESQMAQMHACLHS
ncbi:uncharacterized protein O3Q21_000564 [Podargus strigoides]